MFLLIFTDALLFCHLAICVCLWEFYLITFFVVILCKWRAVCEPVNTTSEGSSILIACFRISYLTVSLPQAVFIVMCAASPFRICFDYCTQPTICHFLKICLAMGFPANVLYKAPCVKLLAIACMPCRRLHKLGDLKTIDVECFSMWDCTKMKRNGQTFYYLNRDAIVLFLLPKLHNLFHCVEWQKIEENVMLYVVLMRKCFPSFTIAALTSTQNAQYVLNMCHKFVHVCCTK